MIALPTILHLYVIGAGVHDLAPDEAHYWEWSRRLDWSYYSKGPLVAYLIALSTWIGGPTAFFVRLPAVLLGLGTTLLLYRLATGAGARVGFVLVLLICAFPLLNAGTMLMTTDAPLLCCWALLLYGLHRVQRTPERVGWWLLCGVALGTGFLAKYTMLLALPCIALATTRIPGLRQALRSWPPYAALLVAALLATPVLMWNVQHHWVSARHVGTLAGLTTPTIFAPRSPWKFVGGQLGVVTPGLLALVIVALVRVWRARRHGNDTGQWLYWCCSAPLLLFFTLLSFFTDVEANWAAPAYLGALLLAAPLLSSPARGRGLRWGLLALLLVPGWTISAAAHFPSLLHGIGITLPARMDPTARLAGWSDLGAAIGAISAREPRAFLMSESYQVASALAFYTPGHPRVFNINLGRRMNQYDLWGGLDAMAGRDGLYVTAGRWDASHPIRDTCTTLEPVDVIDLRHHGQVVRTFSILRCTGYRGIPSDAPKTY